MGAVVGLLAAGVALAVGELASAVIGSDTSPVTAVGTVFIDEFAASLKDLADRLVRHERQAGADHRRRRRVARCSARCWGSRRSAAAGSSRPGSCCSAASGRGRSSPTRSDRGAMRVAMAVPATLAGIATAIGLFAVADRSTYAIGGATDALEHRSDGHRPPADAASWWRRARRRSAPARRSCWPASWRPDALGSDRGRRAAARARRIGRRSRRPGSFTRPGLTPVHHPERRLLPHRHRPSVAPRRRVELVADAVRPRRQRVLDRLRRAAGDGLDRACR